MTSSAAKNQQKKPAQNAGGAQAKKRTSHDAIVSAAARLFREKGFAGVGVDEIMHTAGLTHGGFYSHFDDKTALMVEALDAAFVEARRYMAIKDDLVGDAWLPAVRDRYLSRGHVDAPGGGCVIPSLGGEVARSAPDVKAAFTRGFSATVDMLDDKLKCTHLSPAERRELVLQSLMTWIGAMTLARAVDQPALVDEILQTAKRATRASTVAPNVASNVDPNVASNVASNVDPNVAPNVSGGPASSTSGSSSK